MNLDKIKEELLFIDFAENIDKDILIVVHNEFEFVRNCIDSLYKNTKNFNLFIWDNASDKQTKEYLEKIQKKKNVKLYRSEQNVGFVVPNNTMAKDSKSPYLILLNSDTEVRPYWDKVLVGFLEKNKDVGACGFQGGIVNEQGLGVSINFGYDVDYICGYCLCIPRKIYKEFGLFDENIKFAYCEDSDFSFRLREKNKKIYACYSTDLVVHYGNRTSLSVAQKINLKETIENNLIYLQNRWSKYLIKK